MSLKEEYRKLVETVKSNAKKNGLTLRNQDIAKRLGYERAYFSTLVGNTGKVLKDHIELFKLHFQNELAGIVKPSLPGEEANREKAMLKVLWDRMAKQEAERLKIPVDKAYDEMERDTMIAWKDLEK